MGPIRYLNLALVGVDDRSRDGQSQPAGPAGVAAPEPIEHMRQHLRIEARTVVGYVEHRPLLVGRCRKLNVIGASYCVASQSVDNLAKQVVVGVDYQGLSRQCFEHRVVASNRGTYLFCEKVEP